MLEAKTKLEVLEAIAKSDNILATEKFCIYSSVLPEEIKDTIMKYATGMIIMGETINKEK